MVMAVYGPGQLAASIRTVRENTIKIADDIPEERYGYRPTAESRSVEELLLHIVVLSQATRYMHEQERIRSFDQYDFGALLKRLPVQEGDRRTKGEIIALLREEGETFSTWLEQLPIAVLEEMVRMPRGADPETKNRFELLLGAKEHEMHHRGQLMVIERLLGIVPHLTRGRQTRPQPAAVRA
jgi:uncharacterized damage-inducible protein DinB